MLSAPPGAPDNTTVLAVDEHEGTAAHRNKDNVYELRLESHDPALKYYIAADIRGTPREHEADKQGCNGEVRMSKIRPR